MPMATELAAVDWRGFVSMEATNRIFTHHKSGLAFY
jgi:hypothetical protein